MLAPVAPRRTFLKIGEARTQQGNQAGHWREDERLLSYLFPSETDSEQTHHGDVAHGRSPCRVRVLVAGSCRFTGSRSDFSQVDNVQTVDTQRQTGRLWRR